MIDGGLRQLFRANIPHFHWQSIETGGTGLGIPDSNACYDGCEFWIEYKLTSGWAVPLRPEQVGWLARRTRAGGRTFIAVRRRCSEGKIREKADELWLFHGADGQKLVANGMGGMAHNALFIGKGGPNHWDWELLSDILIR